jgi:hypothetical protein
VILGQTFVGVGDSIVATNRFILPCASHILNRKNNGSVGAFYQAAKILIVPQKMQNIFW